MSKYEFKKVYAVNLHTTHLVLKGGFISIPVGGYVAIPESDLTHPDVEWALARDWIKISENKPNETELKKPELPFVEMTGYKGLTEEELKASVEKEVEAPKAKAEALGQTTGVEIASEPASERIGETAENVNKRGRKPAASKE